MTKTFECVNIRLAESWTLASRGKRGWRGEGSGGFEGGHDERPQGRRNGREARRLLSSSHGKDSSFSTRSRAAGEAGVSNGAHAWIGRCIEHFEALLKYRSRLPRKACIVYIDTSNLRWAVGNVHGGCEGLRRA